MAGKISELTAAVSVADVDQFEVLQGSANKRATAALIRTGLVSESTVRTANTILAGPTTGAAAAATFRALVAADIPSLSYQPVDATLTALAALASTGLLEQTGVDTFAYRALGVGASTSIPTRADADTRYAALAHAHVTGDVTGLDAALAGLQPLDATLTALAALATLGAANQIIRTNASATALEWADPAGGISGLTAGVIPVATSGTAIGNSNLVFSGAVLSQVNGSTPQTFRVYSDTADYVSIFYRPAESESFFAYNEASPSGIGIRHQDGMIRFYLNNTTYWGISAAVPGLLFPTTDNVSDIGAPTNRVKDIHTMSVKASGRSYLGVPASAPADGDIANGASSAYLDEAGNALKIRVRYSDGTLKLATIALA